MSKPKVTVLLPVYNGAAYLRESLTSILGQSFKDFTLLVIDDASTDSSLDVIRSFGDPRIQVVCNPHNLGLIGTLNKGLNLSTTEYIARMDQDDVSMPDRLAVQVDFLDSNKSVGVCGSWIEIFGIGNFVHQYPTEHDRIKAGLFLSNELAHPTVMLRRQAFLDHNLYYDERWSYVEDYELWQRASFCFEVRNIPHVLLRYRTSFDSMCRVYGKEQHAALQRLDKQNYFALGLTDQNELYSLPFRLRMSDYPLTLEWEMAAKQSIDRLIEANSRKHLYDEVQFSAILYDAYERIRQRRQSGSKIYRTIPPTLVRNVRALREKIEYKWKKIWES